MNGNKFVLDTNTVLYLLNGDETLAEFLFGKELFLSIISEMELLSFKKISPKEQKVITAFINELQIVNINDDIKAKTIALKKESNLKLPDSIIAASAIHLGLPFITSDKQFKTVPKLDLIYYEK
jgi:predicted nucleic acid-binding protein